MSVFQPFYDDFVETEGTGPSELTVTKFQVESLKALLRKLRDTYPDPWQAESDLWDEVEEALRD